VGAQMFVVPSLLHGSREERLLASSCPSAYLFAWNTATPMRWTFSEVTCLGFLRKA